MPNAPLVMVALSGGVDSAVAAWLLKRQGLTVECLHMTNWEDDDGYCQSAEDFHDARRIADQLGVALHRVNFAPEYEREVFANFLDECRAGRTPNPDVLCNREIKFGVLRTYARRLGADLLATGHYARIERVAGEARLLRGADASKDQSYFLHAVRGADLGDVLMPIGDYLKHEVRALAAEAGFDVATKKDSTGICFIGERPFADFLGRYLPPEPGPIETDLGDRIGTHSGLHFYTLGQRRGLAIGGRRGYSPDPWYVAGKNHENNTLIVVQGKENPALYHNWLAADDMHWINTPPSAWHSHDAIECTAKTRYRQVDHPCTLIRTGPRTIHASFDVPQWAVTPGQFAVFYDGDRCLGGARITAA